MNKLSFTTNLDKFVNSYLTRDKQYIVVELLCPLTLVVTKNPYFKYSFELEGKFYGVFNVPKQYKDDVEKFLEGKYSEFSATAKEVIKKKSGLSYKIPTYGGLKSALELLALDKDKELKDYWERKLEVKLSEEAELFSSPGEGEIFDLENNIEQEQLLQ